MKSFFIFLFIITSCASAWSQTPRFLQVKKFKKLKKKVRQEFKGFEVRIKNVRYRGARRAIGEFWSEDDGFGIAHGIVLTTGRATDASPINDDKGKTTTNFNTGNRDLKKLTDSKVQDVSVLQFDFYPNADFISFNFIFASEHYPEFINSNYNDILAFVLTLPNGNKVNFAHVPNTNLPINVSNINQELFPEYYINNCTWDAQAINPIPDTIVKITPKHKLVLAKRLNVAQAARPQASFPIQYDGFTKVLKAQIDVRKNKKHQLKIIIADNSNRIYDSAVFVEMGSFHSHNKETFQSGILARKPNYYYTLDTLSMTNLEPAIVDNQSNEITICISQYPDIVFDYDSPILEKSSALSLKRIAQHLKKCPHLLVKINGYAAAKDDAAYNSKLSKERSERVRAYLVKYGVPDEKIEVKWHGAAEAKTKGELANNRKVKLEIVPR